MGDHRAEIKLFFYIHGKTYKRHFEWINYCPNSDGVDRRIKEWFKECWEDAYRRYQDKMDKVYQEQHKKEIERQERALLKQLKEKYEK